MLKFFVFYDIINMVTLRTEFCRFKKKEKARRKPSRYLSCVKYSRYNVNLSAKYAPFKALPACWTGRADVYRTLNGNLSPWSITLNESSCFLTKSDALNWEWNIENYNFL